MAAKKKQSSAVGPAMGVAVVILSIVSIFQPLAAPLSLVITDRLRKAAKEENLEIDKGINVAYFISIFATAILVVGVIVLILTNVIGGEVVEKSSSVGQAIER